MYFSIRSFWNRRQCGIICTSVHLPVYIRFHLYRKWKPIQVESTRIQNMIKKMLKINWNLVWAIFFIHNNLFVLTHKFLIRKISITYDKKSKKKFFFLFKSSSYNMFFIYLWIIYFRLYCSADPGTHNSISSITYFSNRKKVFTVGFFFFLRTLETKKKKDNYNKSHMIINGMIKTEVLLEILGFVF